MNENQTIVGSGNATVTPAGAGSSNQTIADVAKDTMEAVAQAMEQFEGNDVSEEQVEESKGFLRRFTSYIQSAGFKDSIMETSKKYNLPPKKVAEGFFQSCLGTIGDVLGIGISAVGNAGHTVVDVLSAILHGAVNVVVFVAQGLARFVTLNKTCVAPA